MHLVYYPYYEKEVPNIMVVTDTAARLELAFDAATGACTAVRAHGRWENTALSAGGVCITDVVTGKTTPVCGAVRRDGRGWTLNGEADGLQVTLRFAAVGETARLAGTLHNPAGGDRLVAVTCRFPVEGAGLFWPDDMETKRPIVPGERYTNATNIAQDQFDQMVSLYPFGGVTDGTASLAIGVPMDPPGSREIFFEGAEGGGYLGVVFRMVLSDKTLQIADRGAFSLVLYAPEAPEWGFRAMAQGYYDRFPEQFVRRVKEGGNWLFQHDYTWLENVEDYHFRFNETPGSYLGDAAHSIVPFQYTAPGEVWMEWKERPKDPHPTYEEFMERFAELQRADASTPYQDFDGVTLGQFAEAIANSAIHTKEHKYRTLGWHAYGPTVAFITNHSPSIPGWNLYRLQMQNVKKAERQAKEEGAELGGVYIDNMTWGYDNWYNYRQEHFAYSPYPLLWDDDKTPVLPVAFTQYEYAKAIHDQMRAQDKLILANSVFPEKGAVCYTHLVDVPGSEVGPRWGHDLWIQRLRRTMAYRKPWCLLLTNDLPKLGPKETGLAEKEQVMKDSLLYGLFANIIGYRVPRDDYEACRYLFRKYLPPVVLADHLGWRPVTRAAFEPAASMLTERFGCLGRGMALYTAMNTGDEAYTGRLRIEAPAVPADAAAWDMVAGRELPLTAAEGGLACEVQLDAGDVAAIVVAGREALDSLKEGKPL